MRFMRPSRWRRGAGGTAGAYPKSTSGVRGCIFLVVALVSAAACQAPDTDRREPPTAGERMVGLPLRPPLVIAHRGASAHRPEHTWAAWDLAVEMGADYLELDLRMTADGALVVLHDPTLDRTASGPRPSCGGPVRERTLSELADCEVGGWFDAAYRGARLPTLDSVLARYPDARFFIETKDPDEAPDMEESLITSLARHDLLPVGPDRRVVVQSFSAPSLRRVGALAPSIPLVQLFRARESQASIWRRLPSVATWARGIGLAAEDVDPHLVAAAHARCLEVHPHTVDEPSEMDRLLRAGVDGMFTNRPGLLREVLAVTDPETPGPRVRCAHPANAPDTSTEGPNS